jgi:hypothetical protein
MDLYTHLGERNKNKKKGKKMLSRTQQKAKKIHSATYKPVKHKYPGKTVDITKWC